MARAIPSADVLDSADAVRSLRERSGRGELIEFFVVAALHVHDRALTRAGDLDHRETVRRGVGQRNQAVEEAGPGHRQAHAGPAGEESGGGRGVAGGGLVPETDEADSRFLRQTGKVGDRDPDEPIDGVDSVELEGVDEDVEAVGQLGRCRLGAHGDDSSYTRGPVARTHHFCPFARRASNSKLLCSDKCGLSSSNRLSYRITAGTAGTAAIRANKDAAIPSAVTMLMKTYRRQS